jgi:hypothetical protein
MGYSEDKDYSVEYRITWCGRYYRFTPAGSLESPDK